MKKTREIIIKNFIKFIGLMLIVCGLYLVNINQVEAAKMHLSKTSLTLKKGASKKLKIKNLPKAKVKVTWSTSNKYAAKVSKKGKVKALNYGTAIIKAKCKKKVFTCTVNIPDTSRMVTLNTNSITLVEDSEYCLVATSSNKVQYHSGNEAIATVNDKGVIKAVNPGIVTITAKSSTGYANCVVSVTSSDTTPTSPSWMHNKKTTAIRRLTKNDNFVYDDITWAKGKDITFKIANIDESEVKKCKWSISDTNIVSSLTVSDDSKIQVSAKTVNPGTATIEAKVTYKNGNKATYINYVYVTNPTVNAKEITLFGPGAGSNRQQFISIDGLSEYSEIEWSNSNYLAATISTYNTKAAVWGVTPGSGTITASVDGKKIKVNYVVKNPVFGEITSMLIKGKKTKINITGLDGVTPVYTVRNSKVAKVDSTGTITGVKAGVTYVDVKLDNMTFSYRVEVAVKGMKKIVNRATYIVNNWKYSQKKRMKKGYYDCSALVWKGYKEYKKYHKKLGSSTYALPSAELFDYLYGKNQIIYFGNTSIDNLQPGDLIFYGDYNNAVRYSTPGRTLNIYHVSMYAGNGEVVEKGGQSINTSSRYIVGIGRVVK